MYPPRKTSYPASPVQTFLSNVDPCPDVPARRAWCPFVDHHFPRDFLKPDYRFHYANFCPASNPHPKSPTWEPKGRSNMKGGRAKRVSHHEMGLYRDHSCEDGVSSTCLPLKLIEKGFGTEPGSFSFHCVTVQHTLPPHTPV